MDQYIIYLALVLVGLCFGSFAGASVWRLRARQLAQDKADGEEYDKAEYKKLQKIVSKDIVKDRSKCLHCGYTLEWYDMIPLISWLSLGGKCRKCRANIGWMELLIELSVATFFVVSYIFWPYSMTEFFGIVRFAIWLVSGVVLAILFVYDKKWFLLPNLINYVAIVLGLLNAILVLIAASDKSAALISIAGSILILSGLYLFLYLISKGKWIGFGDIKLGLGLALLLADWKLAFIALFAANLVGCLIVLPAVAMGRLKRDSHVPFGPLLIIGALLAGLAGNYLINIFIYSLL